MLVKAFGIRAISGTLAYTFHEQGVDIENLVGAEGASIHVELLRDDD